MCQVPEGQCSKMSMSKHRFCCHLSQASEMGKAKERGEAKASANASIYVVTVAGICSKGLVVMPSGVWWYLLHKRAST